MTPTFTAYKDLLITYLKPQWRKVVLLGLALFSTTALQLVNPQILGYFIDLVQAGASVETLIHAAGLFLVVVFVSQAGAALIAYLSEDVGWTATNALRTDLAFHCLHLDLSFHQQHTPGELIERIDGDVNALADFFSTFVLHLLGAMVLLVGAIILLFQIEWRVGWVLSLYAAICLLVLAKVQGIGVPYFRALSQARANLSSFLAEWLAGTEDIRSSNAENYVMRRLYTLMRTLLQKGVRSFFMQSVIINTSVALFAIGNGLVFALGAYLFALGAVTIGSIYIIVRYTDLLTSNLRIVALQMNNLQRATAAIQRIHELYQFQAKVQDGSGAPVLEGALAVTFQNVTFGYDPGNQILHNLSFHLAPGTTLGLLGRTGSGKTTLGRLLFRFYDPEQGVICLNDIDLRQFHLGDLRPRIGVVTQDVQLFNATVRENLTFFDAAISDTQIRQAIHHLGLDDWYQRLPAGLDTELVSGGSSLSAGEAQLLALTRVFLRNPSLVILDEASSRLDPATEHLLEQAIERLLAERTAIIIAHRLQTVERADEIMILENGNVVEYGKRQTLLQDQNSRFSYLLKTGIEEALT